MPFQMPPVEVGWTVLYYLDGRRDSQPCPAIVTRLGGGHVSLSVMRDGATRLDLFDGVLHVDDPRISNAYNDSGAWDYRGIDKINGNSAALSEPVIEKKEPTLSEGQVKRGPGRPRKTEVVAT